MEVNSLTAQRIREIRDSKKYAAKYVASALDMSLSAYSKMENGETQITIEKLHLVAQALNVGISTLLPHQLSSHQMVNSNNEDHSKFDGTKGKDIYSDSRIVEELTEMLKRRGS